MGYEISKFQTKGHLQSMYFLGRNTINCGRASHCEKAYQLYDELLRVTKLQYRFPKNSDHLNNIQLDMAIDFSQYQPVRDGWVSSNLEMVSLVTPFFFSSDEAVSFCQPPVKYWMYSDYDALQ